MSILRYSYVFGFLVIVAGMIFAGTYSKSFIENKIIIKIVSDIHEKTEKSFEKKIWNKHKEVIKSLPCTKAPCLDIKKLQKDLVNYIIPLPIHHFSILDKDGAVLIGNLREKLFLGRGNINSNNSFNIALGGKKTSNIIKHKKDDGTYYNLVRTFVPLLDKSNNVVALLEVSYDISSFWSHPDTIQVAVISGIVSIFLLVFAVMGYTSLRVEREISKQYESNLELVKQKSAAESENQEKSKFLANISHELRTPLNAIIGFSEIIKDEVMGPVNNQQYMDYIKDIHLSGVHLLSLINDILDFSKLEAGKLDIELQDNDATKIIKNSIRLVSPRAAEAGVILKTDIPKEHFIISTDQKRLKQVLLNLLSNAVKFTPEKGTVTMMAWHDVTSNHLIIEVHDTGVGIAPKDISKVMSQFGQVENELSRKYEGTGLGLPLSKKLMELMGGTLDISSELNQGTKVIIKIPYSRDQDYPQNEAENISKNKEENIQSNIQESSTTENIIENTETNNSTFGN